LADTVQDILINN